MGQCRNSNEYLNLTEVLNRIRGNETTLKLMLGMFLESGELHELEDCLSNEEYDKAADLAHGIKGMAGNLSLNALFRSAAKLNEELKQGTPETETVEQYHFVLDRTRDTVEMVLLGL